MTLTNKRDAGRVYLLLKILGLKVPYDPGDNWYKARIKCPMAPVFWSFTISVSSLVNVMLCTCKQNENGIPVHVDGTITCEETGNEQVEAKTKGNVFAYEAVEMQIKKLSGEVFTILDGSYSDPVQRKAVKDTVRRFFSIRLQHLKRMSDDVDKEFGSGVIAQSFSNPFDEEK